MGSLLQVLFSRIHQVLLKCPLSVTQVLQESLLNSIQDETNIHSNTYSNFIITIFISISLKHQSYDSMLPTNYFSYVKI